MNEKKKDQTVTQVAELFGCDAQTVRNWILSGRIRAYRLGGKTPGGKAQYRIPWAEVERAKAEWVCRPETSEAL